MTSFDTIYKIFLSSIQDYRIKKIFSDSVDVGTDMLETFLYKSIPNFENCVKDISNIDTINKTFLVDLDIDEINILSQQMILSWMEWTIDDITQMQMTLDDTDFKHYSEERNMSGKTNHRNMLREIYDQNKINYGLKHTPFADWAVGQYGI